MFVLLSHQYRRSPWPAWFFCTDIGYFLSQISPGINSYITFYKIQGEAEGGKLVLYMVQNLPTLCIQSIGSPTMVSSCNILKGIKSNLNSFGTILLVPILSKLPSICSEWSWEQKSSMWLKSYILSCFSVWGHGIFNLLLMA